MCSRIPNRRFHATLRPLVLAALMLFAVAIPGFAQTTPAATPAQPQVETSSAVPQPALAANNVAAVPKMAPPSALEVKLAETRAWRVMTDAYKSRKASARGEAISALGLIPDNARALGMIESALTDPAPEVRAGAAAVLAQLNAASAIPKIKPLLKDKSPDVTFAAARALSQLGDASGRDILVEVLTGERRVSGGLVNSGKDWAKQFTYKDVIFLGAAGGASAFAGPFGSIGVSAVRQVFFQDHTSASRASSAQALAPDGSDRVLQILEHALNDKDWSVRFSAANALSVAPTLQPVPHLEKLLNDKKSAVRLVSAASIIRLTTPPPPATPQPAMLQQPATPAQ